MSGSRMPSMKRNVVTTIGGNVLYALSQWLLLVILAKLSGTASVGLFSLSLAIQTPVLVLTKLQLRALQVTDAKNEYTFEQYFSLRLYGVLATFGIITPIAFIVAADFQAVLIILVLTMAKTVEMIIDIFYGLLQKKERMDLVSLSLVVRGLMTVLVFGSVSWITGSLLWASVALAVTWLVVLLVMDIRLAAAVGGSDISLFKTYRKGAGSLLRDKAIRRLFVLALPMGLAGILNAASANVPRYFVQYELGEFALGIFSAIAYLIVAGDTIVGAFGQALSPRLARYYAEGTRGSFISLCLRALLLASVIGITSILIALTGGQWLLPLLYNSDFANYNTLFVLVMVAGTLKYVANILGVTVTAMRKFKIQVPVHAVINVALLSLCSLLLQKYGIVGAAYAMIAGSLLEIVAFGTIVVHTLGRGRWTSENESRESVSRGA